VNERLTESWFLRLCQNANEVLRIQQRSRTLLKERPAERFDGIGHLLGKVLPSDSAGVRRFADALGVPSPLVAQLRASELDPLHVPLPALVLIGNALELKEESFLELVWRDHERFAELEKGALARGIGGLESDSLKRDLRAAWERGMLDDPRNA
jgi:hypothetical protein